MPLEKFFTPHSVAIIGASHTPGKVGYSILENFIKNEFIGKIFPINPDTTPIFNLPVYTSINDIDDKIDLAIIAVPAEVVPQVLKECVKKKIESVIIISAGFSEIGKEGKVLEEKLKKIIEKSKTRVIGPNCLGIFDSHSKIDTLFLPQSRLKRPSEGSIAFISQSGAVGSTILDWLSEEKIGISKFVSYGNAIDVNEIDLLEFLSKDEKTKVIAMYLEGVKSQGKKFIDESKRIERKKPIIVLKAGKTDKGTRAVASHTGSLAGSAKIYSSVFRQTGIVEADTWQELFDYAKGFSFQPLPKGNRVAIVTDGGGFGVLATDECVRQGLQLPEPSNKLKKILRKHLPSYAILHNPIDLTGDSNAERYKIAIEECLKSKEYDGVIAIVLFQVPTLEEAVVDVLVDMKKYGKPILCCAAGSRFTRNLVQKLESSSIPVYSTPETTAKTFSTMVKHVELMKNY